MRTIDADALIAKIKKAETITAKEKQILKNLIDEAPTVEELKHGYWDDDGFCSVCGRLGGIYVRHPFCEHCGAKMDLKKPKKQIRIPEGEYCGECKYLTKDYEGRDVCSKYQLTRLRWHREDGNPKDIILKCDSCLKR